MSSPLLDSFLAAGLGPELRLSTGKKSLLCGILDIALLRGDLDGFKQRLAQAGQDSLLKWTRFLVLNDDKKVFLAIRYSNPFVASETDTALYDLELVRVHKDDANKPVVSNRGIVVRTIDADQINNYVEIFS